MIQKILMETKEKDKPIYKHIGFLFDFRIITFIINRKHL